MAAGLIEIKAEKVDGPFEKCDRKKKGGIEKMVIWVRRGITEAS